MKKRIVKFLLALLLLFLCIARQTAAAQTESITITTYYPAPYGVYQNLRLFPSTVPATCEEGNMYYDSGTHQIMLCRQTSPNNFQWQPIGYWLLDTNNLYPIDSNWNVGIGVTTPQAKLDVAGGVKISNDTALCGTANAGTMRYNNGQIQYCQYNDPEDASYPNGWQSLVPSNTPIVVVGDNGAGCNAYGARNPKIYHNTSSRKLTVVATMYAYNPPGIRAITGYISPTLPFAPNTNPINAKEWEETAQSTIIDGGGARESITFVVPASWYYKIEASYCPQVRAKAWEM